MRSSRSGDAAVSAVGRHACSAGARAARRRRRRPSPSHFVDSFPLPPTPKGICPGLSLPAESTSEKFRRHFSPLLKGFSLFCSAVLSCPLSTALKEKSRTGVFPKSRYSKDNEERTPDIPSAICYGKLAEHQKTRALALSYFSFMAFNM